jgi:pilus assembly protein Flp/PilA
MQFLKNFHNEESGQDLVEYALVLAAIAVVAVAGSSSIAGTLNTAISKLNSKITSATA